MSNTKNEHPFIIATRIHLGKQSNPPLQSKLETTISTFLQTAKDVGACKAVIAVDPMEKIPNYDLVYSLEQALLKYDHRHGDNNNNNNNDDVECHILKVTPWGNFVPALNALVSYACTTPIVSKSASHNNYAKSILFISAETTLTKDSMIILQQHMNLNDTLVVGAVLPGHDYHGSNNNNDNDNNESVVVDLNGRTCPWNTLALWNLKKLVQGFPLVADGIHRLHDDGDDDKR